jgi:hypothetical protein
MEEARHGNVLRRVVHAPGRDLISVWVRPPNCGVHRAIVQEEPGGCRGANGHPMCHRVTMPDAFHLKTRIGEDALAVMGLGDGLCYPNDMLSRLAACYGLSSR